MIELYRAENGLDWCCRVTFATKHREGCFATYRRATDWGKDRLEEMVAAAVTALAIFAAYLLAAVLVKDYRR